MQSASSLATIDFYAYSPDLTERVGYVSKMTYADPKNGETSEGGFDDVYLTPVKAFVSAEYYAQEFMSGYFGASMQVLDTRYPEGQDLAALQAYQAGEQQNVDQATAEWLEVNQPLTGVMADVQIRVSGAYVDMRFEQNGVAYKARVCCVIAHATNTTSFPASQYLGAYSETSAYWDTPLFYYYVAEESRFDESAAVAAVFADNLFVNEQWSGALAEAHLRIRQQQWQNWADELAQITQYCQQSAQSYSQSHSQGYSYSSGSLSGNSGSVINGWTNAITGNSYYEGADGAPVLLDDSYYHTYHDGNGGFIQSNDPISGLSEASDLGAMGGG
jgi:hypothetical protein